MTMFEGFVLFNIFASLVCVTIVGFIVYCGHKFL